MFPSEIAILMAVKEARELTAKQLTYATDITGACLRYLCNSLARRGYLQHDNSRGFRITFKGNKAISGTLREMKPRTVDKIKAL
ncbi:MAG: MarR family transcriptional regulator [Dehalococcoidales bacterium]